MDQTPHRPEIWRVYLPEWLVVRTSEQHGKAGWGECYTEFADQHQGMVHGNDWRIVTLDGQEWADGVQSLARLQLRLNNLKGEFADKAEADKLAGKLGDEAEVVAKFSREERRLAEYGKRRLHGAR